MASKGKSIGVIKSHKQHLNDVYAYIQERRDSKSGTIGFFSPKFQVHSFPIIPRLGYIHILVDLGPGAAFLKDVSLKTDLFGKNKIPSLLTSPFLSFPS